MKKAVILFLTSIIIFSCSKKSPADPTGAHTPVVAPDLSSVTLALTGLAIKDSFEYDTANHLARLLQYEYDSIDFPGPVADSEVVTFIITGNGLPSSYHFTHQSVNSIHQLFYNSQNQIIKDTSSPSGYVAYYTYHNNNVTANILFDGTTTDSRIDSLYFSNEEQDSTHVYVSSSDGTADSLITDQLYSFSSYANPAYYPAISTTLGPLLYAITQDFTGEDFGNINTPITDFNSKNTVDAVSHYAAFLVTASLSTILDSKGRVSLITYPADNLERIRYTYYP
ncbi:MAG TPA: hypothetical protein VK718_12565 [Ferruginibacter sp.]|jgi:hypothetical protein|nr:hypothetical protein [Ferruginibacter sp.]